MIIQFEHMRIIKIFYISFLRLFTDNGNLSYSIKNSIINYCLFKNNIWIINLFENICYGCDFIIYSINI